MKVSLFIILIIFSFLATVFSSSDETINISSLGLKSLTIENNDNSEHLKFMVKGKEAGNFEAVIDIKERVAKSLEYFFIGLAVDDSRFWVNLNPREPHRIIDPVLGDTDLGRIMLNADLRLKQDICRFTNPQISQQGKEFWSRLYERTRKINAINKIPVMNRLWIVPGEALVYDKDNEISIVKCRLKVCLESAYLSQTIKIKDEEQKDLLSYASKLLEELVLPYLNKEVNEGYAYADLREVYQALILSRWYKHKSGSPSYSLKNINLDVLTDTKLDYLYAPDQIYRNYLTSLKKGEYSFTESQTDTFSSMTNIKYYFSGGVDFTDIKITKSDTLLNNMPEKDGYYLICNLYMPHNIERPLQYVRSQFDLSPNPDNLIQDEKTFIALVNNLPAITSSINSIKERMRNINAIDRVNTVLLSKL